MKKILTIATLALTLGVTGVGAQEKTMKAYLVSDAHMDTQWNWDVQTTIRSYIWNTMVQNFRLIEQYPDYIFNFEGGVKYAWMKEYYPLQYEQLKKYVAQGRWHPTGSSWDACEVIVCSPESWIRNVLLGQTFYRQEFGKECTDIFLPDCFGFPYTQPTLMAHCGLIGFASQKLQWRNHPFYEGNKKYPFTVGLWQGIDGSKVMMVHGFDYGARWRDEDLSKNERIIREIGESPLNMVYRLYGTGDMGGSPDMNSVRAVEKGLKGDGPVQIISATSDQLYKDMLPFSKHPELPEFRGELTMDVHGNGCYTSQAAMKLYNRQNEHLGDAAERAAVVADWAGAIRYPSQRLTEMWKRTIWHQFHDDLTGTSIPRAYEFSWNDELLSLKTAADVLTTSVGGVTRQLDTNVGGQPVVVFNNEAFPVTTVAEAEVNGNATVSGPDGKKVASQVVEKNGKKVVLFEASVPATGFAVYSVKEGGKAINAASQKASQIENSRYKIVLDNNGDISSLYDKQAGKELVAEGKRIRLVVFDHCDSYSWPAWEILKATLDKDPVAVPVKDVTVENGSLRKTLVVRKKYGETDIVQRIHLYEGAQAYRIDFDTEVDWRSENSLLKAEFPLSVSNPEATYDLGLGSIRRDNNRDNQFEVYSHEWTDLTDRSGNYGVTILSNARYGWDKPNDNTLRHSLIYTPRPDRGYRYQAQQDMGRHVFTYSIIGHQGQLDEPLAVRQAAILNSPVKTFRAPKHKGDLGKQFSFVSSDNDNVIIRALKQAEVSDEYVVRVYEIGGKSQQTAHLNFAAPIVQANEADGTEKTIGAAVFSGNSLTVDIKPYSLKTFKVKLSSKATAPASEGIAFDLTAGSKAFIVPADAEAGKVGFDRRCFSFNEFRNAANFSEGYSYAAELLPDDGLTVDGIHFVFGEKDSFNGLSCKGQTLNLSDALLNLKSKNPKAQTTHLYLLAASDNDDRIASFKVGKTEQKASVPNYTGFIGQWGHDGHTKGFLKDARVAYVGTHRHSPRADEVYEYTYMYLVKLDVPKGVTSVTLPEDQHVVIFAATLAADEEGVTPVSTIFETSLADNGASSSVKEEQPIDNILKKAKIVACSGQVNAREQASMLVDGDKTTKWCDTGKLPNYVTFDLGEQKTVSRWHLVNAGSENAAFITRTCLLQGRNTETEEWQTLDLLSNNRNNDVTRNFTPTSVRFVRLYVVTPTQTEGDATRIYELELD